jgi:large subunit ribosomal protein L35
MPKIRTHRGAAKRFKVTGTGKIKRNRAYKSSTLVSSTQYAKMKKLLNI